MCRSDASRKYRSTNTPNNVFLYRRLVAVMSNTAIRDVYYYISMHHYNNSKRNKKNFDPGNVGVCRHRGRCRPFLGYTRSSYPRTMGNTSENWRRVREQLKIGINHETCSVDRCIRSEYYFRIRRRSHLFPTR
ncbi:unnamed protein product [Aphis gossypii]|uniref:Uncharacterized protein n=1 Tax=Aphis gossypii TaxID=80765 RepID=A0A9P0IWP0_APHGO|nr:unnamed protein product [Aphis gossypii]